MKPIVRFLKQLAEKYPVVHMTAALLLLTVAVALAMGFVHGRTAPVIAERQASELRAAVAVVLPGAADSAPLAGNDWPRPVKSVREVYDGERGLIGYAVESTPSGFSGAIRLLVGVSSEGRVTGVAVLTMKETPNLGTKAQSESFLSQFIGREAGFKMSGGVEDVQAISGATVTSEAIFTGVSAAVAAVWQIMPEGGASE